MATSEERVTDRAAATLKRALVGVLQLRDTPESIALGAAVGMFIGLTPTVGIQTGLALLATIHWRVNRTAALIAVFISNPFTTGPVYAVDYIIGKAILRNGPPLGHLVEAVKNSEGIRQQFALLFHFGWPLLLGGIVVGFALAVPTYFIVLSLIRNERRVMGVDLTKGVDRRVVARWRWRSLVLASASARREALLRDAGFWFEIIVPEVDETPSAGVPSWRAAEEIAARKGHDVARKHGRGTILAADTIVEVDGEILGKPADAADARRMLERLSGSRHRVITGVALVDGRTGSTETDHAATDVKMKELSAEEIDAYVASGEGLGKAGGYALQESGDQFVEQVDGSVSNVIGLPLELVEKLLDRWEHEHRTKLLSKLTRGGKR